MFPGYRTLLNAHAFKTVLRNLYIPEPALGIGFAEVLNPVISPVKYEPPQVAKVSLKNIKTNEDIVNLGTGRQFTEVDFPRTGYMGEGL